MPEWLAHLLTALASILGAGAFWKGVGYLRAKKYQHIEKQTEAERQTAEAERQHDRQARIDEIDVLHQTINELRRDFGQARREYAAYQARKEKELADLRDDHTACKVATERLQARVEFCEAELKRLRGAGGGENSPR